MRHLLWAIETGFLTAITVAEIIAIGYVFIGLAIRFFRWMDNLNYAENKWRVL